MNRSDVLIKPAEVGATAVAGLEVGMADDLDKRTVGRLLTVMERFRRVRHTMPVHLAEALLRVACHEGRSVIWYAKDAGVSQSVMSRHLLELGEQYVKGEPGLGLVVKRTSPNSLREFEVYLTRKGREVVTDVARTLRGREADA